jgi:hypothetical protein
VGGGGEVALETYTQLQSPDDFPQAVLRRIVRGVSTREFKNVVEMAQDGFGVVKSSVSRGFVRASAADVKRLELGVTLPENTRRNHTFAPRAETTPCQRERL